MDLSKLHDDVIKYVESFVDKRPPFADELLNRKFTPYKMLFGDPELVFYDDGMFCFHLEPELSKRYDGWNRRRKQKHEAKLKIQ